MAGNQAGSAGQEPIRIGDQKQLFIDRRFIANAANIALSVNSPVKRPGAAIRSDRPWDAFRLIWLTVAEDAGLYKMWYQAFDVDQWQGGKSRLCLAVSQDGFEWKKPSLGLVEYRGSLDNNIVVDDIVNSSVFIDPRGKP